MGYRADIDGLRAVSVLLILFYHAGLASVPGGFIGVDVFFVISGFLITTLLMKELESGSFSFKAFYMRRLRRLGPAFLITVLVTLGAGWFILSPDHYQSLGESAVAALFAVSNIWFWSEAGYFDTGAYFKPLLHTWSLAVEEQFYFIWPALLLLSARILPKSSQLIGLVLLAVISLIAAEWLLEDHAATAFFLTPFRIYEFAVGAGLAMLALQARSVLLSNICALVGLMLILYLGSNFYDETPFPGLNALLPALGAGLMIYAGPLAIMNQAISIPPIRYIGKISYSLYLVHWPFIIYYRYLFGRPETSFEISTIMIICVGLGALLYHVVEVPTRATKDGEFNTGIKKIAFACLAGAVLITASGLAISATKGAQARFSETTITKLDELSAAFDQRLVLTREPDCHVTGGATDAYDRAFDGCLPNTLDQAIVVLGDSHAADLYLGLRLIYPNANIVQLTGDGCNIAKELNGGTRCAPYLRMWQNWLDDHKDSLSAIIYTHSSRSHLARGAGGIQDLSGLRIGLMDRNLAGFMPEGVPFFYWGPRSELRPPIDLAIVQSETLKDLQGFYGGADMAIYAKLDQWLASRMQERGVTYLNSQHIFCPSDCTPLTPDGDLIYVDYAHWSPTGAEYAVGQMVTAYPELKAALETR